MENFSIKELVENTIDLLTENKSPICFGFGIASTITTFALCLYYGPKIKDDIYKAKHAKKMEEENIEESNVIDADSIKLTPIETGKAIWKDTLPVLGGAIISIGFLSESFKTDRHDILGLTAGYELLRTKYKDLDNKFLEKVGEKKHREAKEEIASSKVSGVDPSVDRIYGSKTDRSELFKDGATGRLFWSDVNTIKDIANKINYRLIREGWISVNDFFYEVNLKELPLYSDLGWKIERGLFEPTFGPALTDDGQSPCIVVDYDLENYNL